MICFFKPHDRSIKSLLKRLKSWDHKLVNDTVRIRTAVLDKCCHSNVRSLGKVNTSTSIVISYRVLMKGFHCSFEIWCQSILFLLLVIWWFAWLSKLFKCWATLVWNSWSVSNGFDYAYHELWHDLRVGQHIWVMLTNSTHHPTYCFSYFPIFIFEHLQKVLKSLDDYLKELLFLWTFGDWA